MAARVTVIMVVRNEEKHVSGSVSSVLGQTMLDFELLVVDGRSEDSTREIVSEIASRDSRVKLLDNPHYRIPSGLNIGLSRAHGEFIARLDGHCRWDADYLTRALNWLDECSELGAVGGMRRAVGTTIVGGAVARALGTRFGVGNSIYHYSDRPQYTDHATNGVYRTAAVRSIGGWDEGLIANEDVDLDHRLGALPTKIWYDPRMTTAWNVRETILGLAGQYRRYGRGKAAMVRKNGASAIRLRHLAPPLLITAYAAAAVCVLRREPRPMSAVAISHLAVLVAGAVDAGRLGDRPARLAALDAVALAVMHFCWGGGFLEGLVLQREPKLAS